MPGINTVINKGIVISCATLATAELLRRNIDGWVGIPHIGRMVVGNDNRF